MKNLAFLKSTMAKFMIFVMAFGVFAYVQPAQALNITSFTDAKIVLSTLSTGEHSNYTATFKYPTGFNFDASGGDQDDTIYLDFGEAGFYNQFGYATTDFAIGDGTTTYNMKYYTTGAGAVPTCGGSGGTNNVAIAWDTTSWTFKFQACIDDGFTPTANLATITIAITGHMANASTPGSEIITISADDEWITENGFSSAVAIGIIDIDTVTVNAQIDPSITFDIDIDSSTTVNGESGSYTAYMLDLGRWTGMASHYSGGTYGTTTVNYIELDLGTNAPNGLSVTVADTDATRTLTSGSDNIGSNQTNGNFASATGYGICVVTGTYGSMTVGANFDGDASDNGCSATDHVATTPPAAGSPATIISTTGQLADTWIEIAAKARTAGTEPAHTDYQTSIRFIATATF